MDCKTYNVLDNEALNLKEPGFKPGTKRHDRTLTLTVPMSSYTRQRFPFYQVQGRDQIEKLLDSVLIWFS